MTDFESVRDGFVQHCAWALQLVREETGEGGGGISGPPDPHPPETFFFFLVLFVLEVKLDSASQCRSPAWCNEMRRHTSFHRHGRLAISDPTNNGQNLVQSFGHFRCDLMWPDTRVFCLFHNTSEDSPLPRAVPSATCTKC